MSKRNYETLGVMIDMSRNAVMSVAALKKYLPYLKKMGYNCVMLYTEDTYEVDGEPYFGYMRGRYTKAELKELDAYAASLGIELIPCIQTLAHLQGFVPWKQVPVDRDDIMMVDEPRVYEFIENLLATLRECFTSKRIHVGMDEAWALGRGKFMDKNGYEDPTSIMKRHLARVCEIVRKYDFQPMIWSDMFFRTVAPNGGYYMSRTEMPEDVKNAIPEDVIPVYWDYYQEDKQVYDDMLYNHKQLSDKTWFAGGAWTWRGPLPMNNFSIKTMTLALDACREHKIKNIFFTLWGDDGAECSRYSVMPTLYYLAEYARGNKDEAKIKAGFKRLFGVEFDDFMSLDALNTMVDKIRVKLDSAPKMVLYNDLFNGFLDPRMLPKMPAYIAEVAAKWHACAKKYRKWSYLFDSAAKLADVFAVKYDLGIRTRAAYKAGDKEALKVLADGDYVRLSKLLRTYLLAFEKQWYTENKQTGFDVQDIRLGGLIQRVDSCRRHLLDFAAGKLDAIHELEVELIDGAVPSGSTQTYGKIVTPNRLTHRVL